MTLTQCKACETLCEGEFCSPDCQGYWHDRDRRL